MILSPRLQGIADAIKVLEDTQNIAASAGDAHVVRELGRSISLLTNYLARKFNEEHPRSKLPIRLVRPHGLAKDVRPLETASETKAADAFYAELGRGDDLPE